MGPLEAMPVFGSGGEVVEVVGLGEMSLRGVPEGGGRAQPAAAVAAVLFEVVGDVMAPMERERGTGITAELVCGACRRWHDLHQDTLHADKEHRSGPLLGTTSYDRAGRGATAVWRAERQVCLQYF